METQSAFDLEEAVGKWREGILQGAAIEGPDLEELETHLRDSIMMLAGKGLSREEAFWVSTHRLGTGSQLQEEYGKVNPHKAWLEQALWLVAGALAFSVISGLSVLTGGAVALAMHLAEAPAAVMRAVALVIYPLTFVYLFTGMVRMIKGPWAGALNWMQRHRAAVAVAAVVVLLGINAAGGGMTLFSAKLMPFSVYADTATWRIWTSLFPIVAAPIALVMLLGKLERTRAGG